MLQFDNISSTLIPPPVLSSLNEMCIVAHNLYITLDGLKHLGIDPFRIVTLNSTTVPKQELHVKSSTDIFEILIVFAHNPKPKVGIMQPLTSQMLMQSLLS